jgi:hypothetical protein
VHLLCAPPQASSLRSSSLYTTANHGKLGVEFGGEVGALNEEAVEGVDVGDSGGYYHVGVGGAA